MSKETISTSAQYTWGVSVTSGGDIYVLIENSGYLQMWKKSGGSWSNVGTNQYYTDVHGKKGTAIGYSCMDIDSSDVLHVVDYPIPAGVTIDLAYNTFDTSTDSWGTWVEIDAVDVAYTSSFPTLMIDASDNVWVIWGNQDSKNVKMVHMTTNQSGSWATTTLSSNNSYRPLMGIDSNGSVHAWYYISATQWWGHKAWTSGSGWGSETAIATNVGAYLAYPKAVADSSGNCYTAQARGSPASLVRRNKSSAATLYSTPTNLDTTYANVDQTVVDGTQYILWLEDQTTGNKYDVYEWDSSGDSWSLRWNVDSSTSNMVWGHLAYSPFNANYTAVHAVWIIGSTAYYMEMSGTPVEDSHKANATGALHPTDSQEAYLYGGWNTSQAHAMTEGYTDGVSVRHAWMTSKPASIPAYMRGSEGWYFDVIPFNASTSTGTQNITGDLNGNEPIFALFMGQAAVSNDTATDDYHYFFGYADDTYQLKQAAYIQDGSGSSQYLNGAVYSTHCVGLYTGGGAAEWNSWLTDGVQLNWTSASGVGAYICAALLVGTDTQGSFQSYQGTISINDANDDDLFEITDAGFKPDLVIFMNPQDGAGLGVGVAVRDKATDAVTQWSVGVDYYSGYFNYPGICNSASTVITDGVSGYAGLEAFGIDSWLDNGFVLKCIANDGVRDTGTHYYVAIKIDSEVLKIGTNAQQHSSGTGSKTYTTGFKTGAVMMVNGDFGYNTCAYPYQYGNANGVSFFDATSQVAGCGVMPFIGSVTIAHNFAHNARAVLLYQSDNNTEPPAWTKIQEATVTSMDSSGFTLNHTTGTGCMANWLAFGVGYNDKDAKHAYMYAHDHRRHAHTWGQAHPTNSQHAFFHVVDAQDSIHAYSDSIEPARNSTPAFMSGADDPLIIAVPFTCSTTSGIQTITDSRLNGLTPKAAYFYLFEGDDDEYAMMCQGVTDGTSTYVYSTRSYNDTQYYFNTATRYDNDAVLAVTNGNPQYPAVIAEAAFSSFVTNGVQISWYGDPPEQWPGVVILFAGSELSAKVVRVTEPASPGNQSVTSVGFEADLLWLITGENPVPGIGHYCYTVFGWVVNDEHSPYPSQNSYTLFHNAGSPYYGGEASAWAQAYHTWGYLYRYYWYVTAFTSTGFDLHYDYSLSDRTHTWLAIKLDTSGRRKAHIIDSAYKVTEHSKDLAPYPSGPYNLVPELTIGWANLWWYQPQANYNLSIIGGGTWGSFTNVLDSAYMGNPTEAWDQYGHSRVEDTYNFVNDQYISSQGGWLEWFKAIWTPIVNGVHIEVDVHSYHVVWDDYTFHPEFLMIGLVEYKSSTAAYTKGLKENWPSNTPRGCYLEGSAQEETSSTPAFIQAITIDSTPAFLAGYQLNISAKPGFLRGKLDSSDSTPAYMYGSANDQSNVPAYSHGDQDATPFVIHAFAWGQDTASSSISAFIPSILGASASVPCYIYALDPHSSTPAFLEGMASTSSVPAYTEGFSNQVSSSVSAYLNPASYWPFTDNFTGSEEDPWNIAKWFSEEYGDG